MTVSTSKRFRPLTTKQEHFADLIAKGVPARVAAKQAGYTSSSMAFQTLKNPIMQKYVAAIRAESRAIVAYDLATAMQEALDVIAFAKDKGNAMAYCKAVELRAKLSGLLVDKVEVVSVDLTKALAMAESRVFHLPALKQVDEANTQANPPE